MALLSFTPFSGGPRTATSQLTLRAAAILTTGEVDTDLVNIVGYDFILFRAAFTLGSLTNCLVKVYLYDGTSWTQTGFKATQGAVDAGHSIITPDTLSFKATQTIVLPPVSCIGFQQAKVSVQGTGTVTSSSIAISATAGCYTGIRA